MPSKLYAAEQHRATLGLSSAFSALELKSTYRKLIWHWHPDRFALHPQEYAEATERAKAINIAYEFLSELVDRSGGRYEAPGLSRADIKRDTDTSSSDFEPSRTYEKKTYTQGFPDPTVTEVFVKSSNIISTAYNRSTRTLFIKFSGNSVYQYFNVPLATFEAFLNAPSQGKFAHKYIYNHFEYERC